MKKVKYVAMIPARLGSKRVKKKNIRLIGKKPLIEYVISKVKKCKFFDEIYLNSESVIFEKIAKKNNIKFYKRNKSLSTDKSTNDQFALDFISNVDVDVLIQILPTSPLIEVSEIKNFFNFFKKKKLDTLISVSEHQIASIYKNKPINFNKLKPNPPSQKMIPLKSYATVLMAWKCNKFKSNMSKYNSAYHGGDGITDYFTLKPLSCLDIDNEDDFNLVERIILANKKNFSKPKYYR